MRAEYTWNDKRNCWEKNVKCANGKYTKLRAYGRGALPELKRMIREHENQQEELAQIKARITVAKLAEEWYSVAAASLAYKSRVLLEGVLRNHIIPAVGDVEMLQLTPAHIDRLMAASAALSHSMQSKILGTMKRVCRYALENGYILRDPCSNKSAAGASAKPIEALTEEQRDTLLEAVKGTRAWLFCMIGLYAGLRRGEILGLAWEDVHLHGEYAYIDVTHNVHFEGDKGVRTETLKTDAARRKVPVPKVLADALRTAEKTDAMVIPASKGGVCTQTSFRRLWDHVTTRSRGKGEPLKKTMVQSNGHPYTIPKPRPIDFEVRPHILRHTYISELCAHSAETGMDIKTIQYLAGHSDPTVTLKIYAHVMQTRQADTAMKIDKIFK